MKKWRALAVWANNRGFFSLIYVVVFVAVVVIIEKKKKIKHLEKILSDCWTHAWKKQGCNYLCICNICVIKRLYIQSVLLVLSNKKRKKEKKLKN